MTAGEWATPVAATLADVAVKSAALFVVASIVALCLRRAPASARHAVWLAAVAGALAMPALSLALPALRVPVVAPAPAAPVASTPIMLDDTALAPKAALGVPADAPVPRLDDDVPWRALALAVWLAGVAVVVARSVSASRRVRSAVREGRALSGDGWDAAAARASERLGLRRPARLVVSPAVAAPATWGARSPVVLLPEAAESWPEARREAVLLHELAHVARRDCATQLLASAACALYWFDPLAWLAAAAMRDEREHAADDRVLDAGVRASDYASLLVDTARATPRPFARAAAAFASERRSHLERRVRAVLDPERPRRAAGRTLALAAVVVATFALAPIAGAVAPGQKKAVPPPPPPAAPDVAPPAVDPPNVPPPPAPPRVARDMSSVPAPPDTAVPPPPPPEDGAEAPLPPAPPVGEPPPPPPPSRTGGRGAFPHSLPAPTPTPTPTPAPEVELTTPDDVPPEVKSPEDRVVVDALQQALRDEDEGVREQARWAIRMMKIRNGEVRVRTRDNQ